MRRGLPLLLLIAPVLGLSALGVVMVTSTTAHQGTATFGDPRHFALRQVVALILAAVVALGIVGAGARRAIQAAPLIFAGALVAALAVFVPGIGVRAAGARRWLHLGPLSVAPAPFLTLAVGLIVSAWGRGGPVPLEAAGPAGEAARGLPAPARARTLIAVAAALLAVLVLSAEPDFSAAGIALAVGVMAFAGLGIEGRRLVPVAAALALALALVASQFGYVGGRLHGFLSPEQDRRGKGFEVLALARASAGATPTGVGLGHGEARRRLSSPASDYVFSVVTEEAGKRGAAAVLGGWLCIAGAAILAARRRDRRLRAAALSSGMALVAPAALHVAVCAGLCPIIGVTMPFVSYDPAATVAAGGALGIITSIILLRDR